MGRGDGKQCVGSNRRVVVQEAGGSERVLEGRIVLIATGSRPRHPVGAPFNDPDVMDSETDAYKYAAYDGMTRVGR